MLHLDPVVRLPFSACCRCLCTQAMLLPQFPLHVLGSVLARNRTEVYLQLRPQDELVYR